MRTALGKQLGAAYRRALGAIRTSPEIPEPLAWVAANVNLDYDKTAAVGGLVRLDPHQRAPFAAQFDGRVRVMGLQWIEQSGKSSVWRWALVYKMRFQPRPRMVLFESAEKAEEINQRTFEPILKSIPELAEQLNRKTSQAGSYCLRNGAITDFVGGGISLTSKPAADVVLDELDSYTNYEAGKWRYRDAQKRVRTYARRGEGCIVIPCTPKTPGGNRSATAAIFETTNRSYCTLRCRGCGKLSMRSCDIHNLQAEKTEEGEIAPGTIRLVCPMCGHEHVEERDAAWCNEQGGYVAESPDIIDRIGYQLGALGCNRVFSWHQILEAQLASGRSTGLEARVDLYNSWRGLPFEEKNEGEGRIEKLKKRCASLPEEGEIDFAVMGVDTQDNGWYFVIRAVDKNRNTYKLDNGFVVTIEELEQVWDKKVFGKYLTGGIIDAGGHRAKEVEAFALGKAGFYLYKGGYKTRKQISKNVEKLVLCNEAVYRGELLHLIYNKQNKGAGGWFLNHDASKEYLDQMADVRPGKTKFGHFFENWTSTGEDHYFDCEKEILVLLEMIYEDREAKAKAKKIKATSYYQ